MQNPQIKKAVEGLRELCTDSTVPKNVKVKIENIIAWLSKDEEISILVNRALNELDEISDSNNIEPYTRTQLWNIVSLLESVT